MTAAAVAAATRLRLFHQTAGCHWLNFDDSQTSGSGLNRQPGAFRSAIVQDVQDEFLPVERPFEVDQLQVELPFLNALLPRSKLVPALVANPMNSN